MLKINFVANSVYNRGMDGVAIATSPPLHLLICIQDTMGIGLSLLASHSPPPPMVQYM